MKNLGEKFSDKRNVAQKKLGGKKLQLACGRLQVVGGSRQVAGGKWHVAQLSGGCEKGWY